MCHWAQERTFISTDSYIIYKNDNILVALEQYQNLAQLFSSNFILALCGQKNISVTHVTSVFT